MSRTFATLAEARAFRNRMQAAVDRGVRVSGTSQTAYRRARRAWAVANLQPIGLHEARHTFASYMIAAGTNIKSITEIMGHASVTVSIDRYGHMMPGGRDEVVERMDAYFRRSLGE